LKQRIVFEMKLFWAVIFFFFNRNVYTGNYWRWFHCIFSCCQTFKQYKDEIQFTLKAFYVSMWTNQIVIHIPSQLIMKMRIWHLLLTSLIVGDIPYMYEGTFMQFLNNHFIVSQNMPHIK